MNKFIVFVLTCLHYTFSYGQDTATVYLNAKDSTIEHYIVVYPPKLPITGYLLLVPGMFQKPGDVLIQTDLPRYAARQGILTFIPTFKTGTASFGIDTATQSSLLEMLTHIINRYQLLDKRFYIGGFSIGGTCAIKYAELALSNNYPIKPSAAFAIDSPLDFERMYNVTVRETRLANKSKTIQEENNYMLMRFKTEFGGTPVEVLPYFYSLSPYSFSDTSQRAIRPLIDLPIRLYTEPDVNWWLEDGVDFSGMNAFDLAAMANELKRLGSTKLSLISTENKGFRKPGNKRHPHSWSIAEPKDLVKWLLKQN